MSAPNGIGAPGQQTHNDNRFSRARVEVGSTAFWAQRAFRLSYEFSLAAGQRRVLKFTSAVNFVLKGQRLDVDSGAIRVSTTVGATLTGTYTGMPTFGMNRTTPSLGYIQQTSVSTGGDFTGGTVVESARVKSNASSQQTTTITSDSIRALPPGDYYILLELFPGSTTTSSGTFSLEWEELA